MEIDYLSEEISSDEDFDTVVNNEKNIRLYSGEFYCYEMSPREPFVYKHTPGKYEYSGEYRICV